MSDRNPYIAPETNYDLAEIRRGADLRVVRIVFYVHLVAVMFCGSFSLLDAQQIALSPAVKAMIGPLLNLLIMPAVLCWILCPVAMLIVVSLLTGRSLRFRLALIGADLALSAFQIWAMMPAVQ
jgi:hypothetical protein